MVSCNRKRFRFIFTVNEIVDDENKMNELGKNVNPHGKVESY